jgi:hypothetical protein
MNISNTEKKTATQNNQIYTSTMNIYKYNEHKLMTYADEWNLLNMNV